MLPNTPQEPTSCAGQATTRAQALDRAARGSRSKTLNRHVRLRPIAEMLKRYCGSLAVVLAACSTVPEAAAVSPDDLVDWTQWTSARTHPGIVGIYRGGSARGTWELRICDDDSIRVEMRANDRSAARMLRGSWLVQGGGLGLTSLLFILHSEDGRAIAPPRMRGCFSPPDTIWLTWPGPAWFVDPPGLRWSCVRAPAGSAGDGL